MPGSANAAEYRQPAAPPGFDAFFNAIAGQESGGNYKAVNGRTRAAGKYQIMPGNIAAWSKEILGRVVSYNEFLNSPAIQDAIARGKLLNYYTKYGARGAASAWYSGDPKKHDRYTRFRPNEPSIGEYVDQVLKRAGQGGGGRGGAGSANAAEAGMARGGTGGFSAYTPGQNFITENVVDNTTQDTPLSELSGNTASDPFAMMSATAKSPTAPGSEVGTATPQFDNSILRQWAQRNQIGGGSILPETGYNAAIGNGPTTGARAAAIALARQFLGTPYKWGGAAPGGFDCSGLIQYIYKKQGITLPRVSFQQAAAGRAAAIGELQAGDLIWWDNSSRNKGADHIAIWLGNNQILEAPSAGKPVRIRGLSQSEIAKARGTALNI